MTQFCGQGLACIRGGRQVFCDLDFALEPGQAILLTGPNGSGKSTLLRLMAGYLRPSAGQVTWAGEPVFEDLGEYQRKICYIGHLDAIKGVLTVAENLGFWAQKGAPGVTDGALEELGLTALARVPGRLLSSGQRRRLALARLLVSKADLWLMDEPTVGLDAASVRRLAGIVRRHREKGGSIVAASHTDLLIEDAIALKMEDFAVDSLPEMVW